MLNYAHGQIKSLVCMAKIDKINGHIMSNTMAIYEITKKKQTTFEKEHSS